MPDKNEKKLEALFRESEWSKDRETLDLLNEVEESNAKEVGFEWDEPQGEEII